MAEGGGLLNRYREIIPIVGSNPIPSAITFRPSKMGILGECSTQDFHTSRAAHIHRPLGHPVGNDPPHYTRCSSQVCVPDAR